MDDSDITRVISTIYEASADELMWSQVAMELSELFDDSAVGIDSSDLVAGAVEIEASARFDLSLRSLHYEEYDRPDANPGVAALMTAAIGEPFDLWSFVDQHTYDRDPSIRAMLHPQKIDKVLLAATERTRTKLSFITLFRNQGQSDFEPRHSVALQQLSPHIARSMKWQRAEIASQQEEKVARFRTMNASELTGSLTVSPNGSVVHADKPAQVILGLREGLVLRHDKLASRSQRAGQDQQALNRFLKTDQFVETTFTTSSEASTIILERLPIPLAAGGRPGQVLHSISLRRIPKRPEFEISAFVSAFGLTKAEARVINGLLSSANASEAAKRLAIGRETVKTHLSNIYKKTDTASLPQLMLAVGRFL